MFWHLVFSMFCCFIAEKRLFRSYSQIYVVDLLVEYSKICNMYNTNFFNIKRKINRLFILRTVNGFASIY